MQQQGVAGLEIVNAAHQVGRVSPRMVIAAAVSHSIPSGSLIPRRRADDAGGAVVAPSVFRKPV